MWNSREAHPHALQQDLLLQLYELKLRASMEILGNIPSMRTKW